MKFFKYVLLLMVLVGCSSFYKSKEEVNPFQVTDKDYLDHFKSIGQAYLNSSDIQELKLEEDSIKYLNLQYQRIINNNEIIFTKDDLFKMHIVKNTTPFIFSLPGGEIFFSSGLFERHLKSEDLFMAALAAEVLKSKKNIYEKKILIPLGFISTERMLQLSRVSSETKKGINEWSYVVLKRAGFDASAYLNWIQVQNRNSLDFALYLGDSVNISTEEQQFKNFMSKQGISGLEKRWNEANSSKEYYKLLKNINKEVNETRTIRKNTSRRAI